MRMPLLRALPLLGLAACVENGFVERPFDDIAVVAGDFDRIEASLDRMSISYQLYEGYICCAAYDPEVDPEAIALSVETLFVERENAIELLRYDALIVNSGARGLGAVEYNGVEDDDGLIADAAAVEAVRDFVERRGRTLIASDWAYDLIEAAWPDRIDFLGDDAAPDAAQLGEPGTFVAQLRDEGLAEALGQEGGVALQYNYSHWAVMESVGEGVEVLMSGDVEARVSAAEGVVPLTGVPLLVRFQAGGGEVLFSSFHWDAQTAGFTDGALLDLVDGLRAGTASEEAPAEDSGGDE